MSETIFVIRVKSVQTHPHDSMNHTGHTVGKFIALVTSTGEFHHAHYFQDVDHPREATLFADRDQARAVIDKFTTTYVEFEVVEFNSFNVERFVRSLVRQSFSESRFLTPNPQHLIAVMDVAEELLTQGVVTKQQLAKWSNDEANKKEGKV